MRPVLIAVHPRSVSFSDTIMLQMCSTTNFPLPEFFSKTRHTFLSNSSAQTLNALSLISVCDRKTVHSGFSGCGTYWHFSLTSRKSRNVKLVVVRSMVRPNTSTVDCSRLYATVPPKLLAIHPGSGHLTVNTRVLFILPADTSTRRSRVSAHITWLTVGGGAAFGCAGEAAPAYFRQLAAVTRSHGCSNTVSVENVATIACSCVVPPRPFL
mmetsp:Transcript_3065/g.18936  ORF Transcript_3065/g.18936 Transcript_3065/m.18936 type:complete len:211 (-) Transcript_3065:22-654(-)